MVKSGKKWCIYPIFARYNKVYTSKPFKNYNIVSFLGEIACKIDPKNRLAMPARFIKQMPLDFATTFVANRGIEKCLTLYTLPEWNRIVQELEALNLYDSAERMFARLFFRGATELNLDEQNRFLLPKRLLDYADIDKEVVLVGYLNRIEIWSEIEYNALMNIDPDTYREMANKIMSK